MGKHDSFTEYTDRRDYATDVRANQPRWLLRKKSYLPLGSTLHDYGIGQQGWQGDFARPTDIRPSKTMRPPQPPLMGPLITINHQNTSKNPLPTPMYEKPAPVKYVLKTRMQEYKGMGHVDTMKRSVLRTETTYKTQADIPRVNMQYSYRSPPRQAPPEYPMSNSNGYNPYKSILATQSGQLPASALVDTPSSQAGLHTSASLTHRGTMRHIQSAHAGGQQARGRKLDPLTNYVEQIAKYNVMPLLRDQRAGIESIHTS